VGPDAAASDGVRERPSKAAGFEQLAGLKMCVRTGVQASEWGVGVGVT
jgi:hypothetical protein